MIGVQPVALGLQPATLGWPAGIQPGDVILAVNDTPIRNVTQLQQIVSKAGKRIAVLVQRENAKLFVPVDLG